MSVSSEVQRTLVKSPPELWAELSDADALTRHLGELGEIRITSVEPETKVEWEAGDAIGVVELKPSGWGTKVTLSVTRNPPVPEEKSDPVAEPEPVAVVEPVAEPKPGHESELVAVAVVEPEATVETEPPIAEPGVATTEPEIEDEPVATVEPETIIEPEPEPKLGFFARLFRKRRTAPTIVVESAPIVSVDPEPELVAMAAPELIYPEPPPACLPPDMGGPPTGEPVVDLAAELASVEAQMAEETTELLTGVLDRLGAAHHRPFSRG